MEVLTVKVNYRYPCGGTYDHVGIQCILPTAIRYDNKIERVLLFPSNYQATSKHVRAEGLIRSYKVYKI